MKNRFRNFQLGLACGLLIGQFWAPLDGFAITLTGSNGRAVEFVKIKTATPKGLTAQVVADGPVIGIPWEKLDIDALSRDQRAIHEAYLRTQKGETVDLNLGGDSEGSANMEKGTGDSSRKFPGWFDVKAGGIHFMMQMPPGKAKAILVLALGDDGEPFVYLEDHVRGSGRWSDFQNKHGMALLTYNLGVEARDVSSVHEFAFAHKGSAKSLVEAIKLFADMSSQPELTDLPIALYGTQRIGAAFVYNFVQTMPERVLAAVASKGAFYDAEPTEASLNVPMLILWGQYSNLHELWGSENSGEAVLGKHGPKNPLWTNGREYRGPGTQNQVSEYLSRQYLHELIALRMPKEGTGEDGVEADSVEGDADAEGGDPIIVELDRSKGLIGNVFSGEVLKITDPAAAIGEEETYIPTSDFGKIWKQFVTGELVPPAETTPGL